ncbi:cytochrome P450 [Aspergillus violaceofuscus CBS 115571]|uniref:Cytochrome P450 n=1 Tax=Aspergillus violaceofuscus (strain CBS 115571) TaxID=1450538 RepID=A0A2V5IWG1_ASPV1|nr:cytochrome P450 [Aspergillus violaceofuscus CBS 115571]
MISIYWCRSLLLLLTGALAARTLASNSSQSGCVQLLATFPNSTIVSGAASYTTKVDNIWSKTCVEDAYCVFEPESSQDISTGIAILRETQTKFAVRSGGHMPNPGANSITDGVLISLTRLNTLELTTNHEVVQMGPGLRWIDVYPWMADYNLTTAGGRFGPVGVGGLLLGGGISYYGSKVGWSANNVINFEVVLADSRIVHANATSHPELYWALKGGSQNFGIVTRYDMKTFSIQDVWGGTLAYPATSLDAYIHAVANFSSPEGGSADPLAAADPLLLMYPNTSQIEPAAVLLYNAPVEQPAALQAFTNITAASDSASIRAFADFAVEQNSSAYWDSSDRRSFWTTAVKATPEAVYLANTTFIQAAMDQVSDLADLLTSITYQTITQDWVNAARASGGDAIDLDPEDGAFLVLLISNTWTDANHDSRIAQFSKNVIAEIEAKAKAADVYYPFINLNDAGPTQEPFETYGNGQSLSKLKSIRKLYDPSGVFQTLTPGGFKLGIMLLELFTLIQDAAIVLQVGAFISFAWLFLSWASHCRRSRLIPGVYIAGLNGGKVSLSRARQDFIYNCIELMLEGYEKTEGGLYYLPSPAGERLMIPTKYLDELKNAANEDIDFTASFSEMFEGKYTTIGQKWHLHPDVVKRSLNANLERIIPDVHEEIVHAYQSLLPPSQVRMAEIFTQIISRSSNRMLGGKALSRNRDWTDTSINFTSDTWLAAQQLKRYPEWLRPIIQYLLPEMGRVRRHFTVAREVICPIVKKRSEATQGTQPWNKPLDLLQMLWEGAGPADQTPEFMAYTALAISFAAIRTSSAVPTHILYDLCAQPEYVAPLREEIEVVIREEGCLFTKAALNKMVKLDSFMKESQRFNPLSLGSNTDREQHGSYPVTFGRVIQSDRVLHDGLVIPRGTIIGVPAHAISHDATFYPNPSTFSPFRFITQLHGPDSEKKSTSGFVTTNASSSLSWGYGKHACSGRFFAAHEIKLIMAHFLLHYDFQFAGGRTKRPENYTFELQNMPDETVEVLIRRRKNPLPQCLQGPDSFF